MGGERENSRLVTYDCGKRNERNGRGARVRGTERQNDGSSGERAPIYWFLQQRGRWQELETEANEVAGKGQERGGRQTKIDDDGKHPTRARNKKRAAVIIALQEHHDLLESQFLSPHPLTPTFILHAVTFSTTAPLSIRFMMPAITLPGPTS